MNSTDNVSFGREGLAPYATHSSQTRGRLFDEPVSPTRTAFQRDRDRIIHSTAFRRLKHKTQVFVYHVGDHFRTRLTHSIEVAQIARSIARALRADEDLAEALALSHDFGHTPFGHAGEEVLDEVMGKYGGFDHNAQSLRIVTSLERQYAQFDGLNLSWETLEGLVKHNGPVTSHGGKVPEAIVEFNQLFDLELDTFSGVEAQCAAIADDIAYNAHDLDDGLRAGLFTLDELKDLPIASDSLVEIKGRYPDLDQHRTAHEIVRRQITAMVEDVIHEAKKQLADTNPQSAGEVRHCGRSLVTFSETMATKEKDIKAFLFNRMYRSSAMMDTRKGVEIIIRNLFNAYMNNIDELPDRRPDVGGENQSSKNDHQKARMIADFIAGMTDRYAVQEHERMFDETPELG